MMRPGAANFHLPFDYQLLKIVPFQTPKIDSKRNHQEEQLKEMSSLTDVFKYMINILPCPRTFFLLASIEIFDFVLRNLFASKSSSIKKNIR